MTDIAIIMLVVGHSFAGVIGSLGLNMVINNDKFIGKESFDTYDLFFSLVMVVTGLGAIVMAMIAYLDKKMLGFVG